MAANCDDPGLAPSSTSSVSIAVSGNPAPIFSVSKRVSFDIMALFSYLLLNL